MSKYTIYLRRENNEIGISVTDNDSNNLVYKDSFLGDINYYKTLEFIDLKEKFLEYLSESDISFINNTRNYNLFCKLLGDLGIGFESVILDDKTNRVKYMGVKKIEGMDI